MLYCAQKENKKSEALVLALQLILGPRWKTCWVFGPRLGLGLSVSARRSGLRELVGDVGLLCLK